MIFASGVKELEINELWVLSYFVEDIREDLNLFILEW